MQSMALLNHQNVFESQKFSDPFEGILDFEKVYDAGG